MSSARRKRKVGEGESFGGTETGSVNKRATINAINLVRKTLGSRLESKLISDIVSGLESRFDISNSVLDEAVEAPREGAESPASSADGHDTCCYSCGAGGELLCCDTCSSVFHLHCLWPKLSSIPKGAWSCPFCVAQGKAKGDVTAAEQAVKKINLISRGILTSASARADAVVSHLDDGAITVQKSSGRFIVRENDSNQAIEVGRCYNMHDALEAAHALSNGQKYHFATVLSHEVQVTSPSAELQAGAANARQALRCDYCMDNSSILVCAFCGCKECFGKVGSKAMLMCDDCGHRWHPRCTDQPAPRRAGAPWFCGQCAQLHPAEAVVSPAAATPTADTGLAAHDASGGSSAKRHPKKKKRLDSPSAVIEGPEEDIEMDIELSQPSGSGDRADMQLRIRKYQEEERDLMCSHFDAVINAAAVCERLGRLPESPLSAQDRIVVASFRRWASAGELRVVLEFLRVKRGGGELPDYGTEDPPEPQDGDDETARADTAEEGGQDGHAEGTCSEAGASVAGSLETATHLHLGAGGEGPAALQPAVGAAQADHLLMQPLDEDDLPAFPDDYEEDESYNALSSLAGVD